MANCDINDAKKKSISLDPRELIEVRGGDSITVQKTFEQDKTVYTVHYREYAAPTIQVNSAIHKVGTTVASFQFNGQILPGSEDIVSRLMVPDKGLDLSAPFSWTELNVYANAAGLWPKYDGVPLKISATDSTGNTITREAGLDFRHLFFMGFSVEDVITPAAVQGFANQDLLLSILSKYKSFAYNYTVVPAYIYWVFPTGTPTFNEASEGPLPVPLKLDHPNIVIVDEGISRTYRVIRTAVKTRFNNAIITLQ